MWRGVGVGELLMIMALEEFVGSRQLRVRMSLVRAT